jgi:hypothetical protein
MLQFYTVYLNQLNAPQLPLGQQAEQAETLQLCLELVAIAAEKVDNLRFFVIVLHSGHCGCSELFFTNASKSILQLGHLYSKIGIRSPI